MSVRAIELPPAVTNDHPDNEHQGEQMTTTTGDNGGSATRRRFDGKVVLITGAARGQGREEAVRFAAEGANIIGVDLAAQLDSIPYPMATPEDLATTVAMVEAAGGAMVSRAADVRDLAALEAAVAEGPDRFGRLDIVVANAGVMATSLFTELSEQAWDEICLLYTSDAADDLLCVDLGGRRIIKKKKTKITPRDGNTHREIYRRSNRAERQQAENPHSHTTDHHTR